MDEANSRVNRDLSRNLHISKFTKDPLDRTVLPRHIIAYILDKRGAKSLLKKIDKTHQPEISTPTPLNHFSITCTFDDIMMDIKGLKFVDKKTKKMLRETIYSNPSITDEQRKELWFYGSGANIKKDMATKEYYSRLCNELKNYPNYFSLYIESVDFKGLFLYVIRKDLKRTFPNKSYDPEDEMIQKMRSILNCYAKRNPAIGYCQGLNFIAARIIEVVQDEEKSFWILATLLEDILPIDYFSSMIGVLIDQKIFSDMVNRFDKQLSRKFAELEVDPSLFSLQWFVCCYVSTFSSELSNSVWDLLLVEGATILFKAGLVYLSYLKSKILEVKEFNEIFTLIDDSSAPSPEPKEFVKKMGQIYISKRLLNIIRVQYEWRTQEELQNLENKKKARPVMIHPKEPLNCQQEWPVCLEVLEKQKHEKKSSSTLSLYANQVPVPKYLSDDYKEFHHQNSKSSRKKKHNTQERGREKQIDSNTTSEQCRFFMKGLNGSVDERYKEMSKINPTPGEEGENVVGKDTQIDSEKPTIKVTTKESIRPIQKRRDLVIGRHIHICENHIGEGKIPKKVSFDESKLSTSPVTKRTLIGKPLSRLKSENKTTLVGHKTFAFAAPPEDTKGGIISNFFKGILSGTPIFKRGGEDFTGKIPKIIENRPGKKLSNFKTSPTFSNSSGEESPIEDVKEGLDEIDDEDYFVTKKPRKTLYNYMIDTELIDTANSAKKSVLFMQEFFKE